MRFRVSRNLRWTEVAATAAGAGVWLFVFASSVSRAEERPGPPQVEGFESSEALMKAIQSGKVPFVNVNPAVPEGVVEEKGIEYGRVGDRALELDLFLPKKREKPVPGLICIHGGGWVGGKRDDYRVYAIRYAEMGYVTATVSYRLSGEAPFPAAVSDAKCAVRWLRANAEKYGVDPEAIGVIGASAGGHLSMMVGYSSDVPELEGDGGHEGVGSRVQAVVNFYGPTDMTTEFAREKGVVEKFLGGVTYDEDPRPFEKVSPLHYLTQDDPPTLVFQGTIDSIVPVDQADALDKKLTELGIDHVYDRIEGWEHTMDLAQEVNDRCVYIMDRFLEKHLPLPPAADSP